MSQENRLLRAIIYGLLFSIVLVAILVGLTMNQARQIIERKEMMIDSMALEIEDMHDICGQQKEEMVKLGYHINRVDSLIKTR